MVLNVFTAMKVPCALPVHLSLPESLETTDLFFFSMVLSFPKCYTVGTIQYVAVAGIIIFLEGHQVILMCSSLENH